MIVDISTAAVALLAAQTLGFVIVSAIMMTFVYYPYNPFQGRTRNIIFAILEIITFVFCYGIIEINWTA